MTSTARRIIVLVATTLGLVAATAGPASAGLLLFNHCEPLTGPTTPVWSPR